MSDSMAFLAGAACAGIAALLLLRGGGNAVQSYLPSPPTPTSPVQPSVATSLPPPPVSQAGIACNPEQQRQDSEQLKAQLEQVRNDSQQLKTQLQNQQIQIETLTAQLKVYSAIAQPTPAPGSIPAAQQQANPIFWGLIWALGGTIVTVMLGIVLAAIFVLFSQKQRPTRTVQVIRPLHPDLQSMPSKRRSQFHPPQIKGSRVDPTDYDM